MRGLYFIIFSVLLSVFIEHTFAQTNTNGDNQCPNQWVNFAQCLTQQRQSEFAKTGLGTPTDSEMAKLQANAKNCFSKFNCRNPLPSDQDNDARLQCFRQSQSQLRSELQQCVKSKINDFILPEDNFGNGNSWKVFLLSLNSAVRNYQQYCQRQTSQRDLRVCVEQALSEYVKQHKTDVPSSGSGRSSNYCEMRNRCKSGNNVMTDSCENDWNGRVVPQLCTCAQDMRSKGRLNFYQLQFINCMNQKQIRVDRNNEPALAWLTGALGSWCVQNPKSKSNDPCATSNSRAITPSTNSQAKALIGRRPVDPNANTDSSGITSGFLDFQSTNSPNWNQGSGTNEGDSLPPPPDQNNGQVGGGFFNGQGQGGDPNGQFQPGPNQGGNTFDGNNGDFGNGNGNSGNGNSGTNNGGFGGGLGGLFGGLLGNSAGNGAFGNNAVGSTSGGGGSDLFGGLLNNLGMGNPFDGGGLLGQFAGLANIFQGIFNG